MKIKIKNDHEQISSCAKYHGNYLCHVPLPLYLVRGSSHMNSPNLVCYCLTNQNDLPCIKKSNMSKGYMHCVIGMQILLILRSNGEIKLSMNSNYDHQNKSICMISIFTMNIFIFAYLLCFLDGPSLYEALSDRKTIVCFLKISYRF